MGDTVKEIEDITEEVTNTTDVPSAVNTLLGWFLTVFRQISASSHPAQAAAVHADKLAANKDALAAAVVANT